MADLLDSFGNKIDTSGKPVPTNVRVILNSGIEIPCVLAYDGVQMSAGVLVRRYKVKAEVDWYRYWVKTLVVGEWPSDVKLVLDTGKETNPEKWLTSEAYKYGSQMRIECEKRIPV